MDERTQITAHDESLRRVAEKVLGYSLTPRLPRVGRIGTGDVDERGKPYALGYFRFVPAEGMEGLFDEWARKFGATPREFEGVVTRIVLRREVWGKSRAGNRFLLHVCDGEHVQLEFDREQGKLIPAPPGTRCNRERCKPTLAVDIVIDGFPGVVRMGISGIYSINEMVATAMTFGTLEGRLCKFFMLKRTITVTTKDGKRIKREIDVVNVWPLSADPAQAKEAEEEAETMVVDPETGEIIESLDYDDAADAVLAAVDDETDDDTETAPVDAEQAHADIFGEGGNDEPPLGLF